MATEEEGEAAGTGGTGGTPGGTGGTGGKGKPPSGGAAGGAGRALAAGMAGPPAPRISPEIEIEFGDSRNRVFAWGPTMEILRGKWTRTNLNSDELVEELAAMPDIPGMRIRINYDRRRAVVYDPLALPENKPLADKISALIKERFRRNEGPAQPVERNDMDKDDLKTWLFWMVRRVKGKAAVLTAGELPSYEEIEKLPGKTRIAFYDSSSRACKWREEFDAFTNAILSMARLPMMAG